MRFLVALTLLLAPLQAQSPAPDPAAAAPATLARVVVIGASVSGGYGLVTELKASVRLGEVLACALPEGMGEITDLGDSYLFQDPREKGEKAVLEALEHDPTLVVAVDFLFWFGYRSWRPAATPERDLEDGLALLDRFHVPLVVGDFPDMTPALAGKGPLGFPMLTPEMIPDEATRARLNVRVAEWAAARGDVVVVSMADMVGKMLAGEEIAVRGNVWPAGSMELLLQADLLHPSSEGVIALVVTILDRLVAARPELAHLSVEWNAKELRARLMARTADERGERLERERRWAEQRARRKQRKEESGGGEGGTPLAAYSPRQCSSALAARAARSVAKASRRAASANRYSRPSATR